MSQVFGLAIRAGGLANVFKQVKGRLDQRVADIHTRLRSRRLLCSDATSARVNLSLRIRGTQQPLFPGSSRVSAPAPLQNIDTRFDTIPVTYWPVYAYILGMYLRTTRRRNQDGSIVEYYQLAETRWDPEKRRPTAQIIHDCGRADTLDRAALLQLARSISRVCHRGLEGPTEVAPPGEAIDLEWARPLGVVHVARALWEELGIGEVLRRFERRARRRAPRAGAVHYGGQPAL